MKVKKTKSWSELAREMCNKQIEQIKVGHALVSDAEYLFSNSLRYKTIVYRAAKRFGKLKKAGLIKENIEEYIKNYPLEAKERGLV